MCWKCGKELTVCSPIARSETCPFCNADVRCCKNCKHFCPGSHYDCKEHIQELVTEKDRSNFCDWFSLNKCISGDLSNTLKEHSAKAHFNSLFGD